MFKKITTWLREVILVWMQGHVVQSIIALAITIFFNGLVVISSGFFLISFEIALWMILIAVIIFLD